MKQRIAPRLVLACLATAWLASPVRAQQQADLRAAAEAALTGSPAVSARLHAYRAAGDAVDAARGALGPRLDLTGDVGRERATFTGALPASTLDRHGLGLQLTQVLWDGLGSRREVQRAGHERLGRYFELLDATEQTALEAVRAQYDLQRFRRLVALARDSVAQHRQAAEKIESRVKAGVGRGVDLEQANARVALAESNLATELANLHDVSARYQRLVGSPPPAGEAVPPVLLDQDLPGTPTEALQVGLGRSPSIQAAVEGVRAARAAVAGQSAGLQPRVELRLRAGGGQNYNGLDDRRTDAAAEVVLNWNLFDGGADRARVRQRANVLGQAMDQRDEACRNLRQTLAIAYNDVSRAAQQVTLLDRNTVAIERARDAYRQQFDIGQRSLLDLLNAENEAHTARRALTNAEYDRAIAYARVHAALSQLNARLGIARPVPAADAQDWAAGDDGAHGCPAQAPVDSIAGR